ncbi:MAG: protease complex subunit PrcB family protein [candidate division WOR-3 bacterium]|nr:protease complex subunit PrcB family protein [candidate division WOR-3 bacterium]
MIYFFLSFMGNSPKEIHYEIVENISLGYQNEGIKIFKSYKEYENFYREHTNIISDEIPKLTIDFNKEILIGIFLGQRPTSGYSINITKVLLENKKINIYANEECPKKDQIVLMVITYPSVFIKIPKYDYPIQLKLNKCR